MSILNRNCRHRVAAPVVAALFTLVFISPPAAAHVRDDPESLRSVLGFTVDGTALEEMVFSRGLRYRMYTTDARSVVTFRVKDDVFVYTIRAPNSALEARALIETLSGKPIRVVVGVQPFRSERFVRFFRVKAFAVQQAQTP